MKKFCRKGHLKRSGKRWLALLMSVCLIGTMIPITARAENGSTETGLCEHHTEHTPECGYVAPAWGHECEHEHDESCGYQEASECNHVHTEECGENGENCTHVHTSECGYAEGHACEHVHDEECGYVEASEGSPCTFVCDICGKEAEPGENNLPDETLTQTLGKLITTWQWIDVEEYLDEETGNLALPGANKDNPAYFDDVTAFLPTQIQATVEEDTEAETANKTITLGEWSCDSYPEEGAYQGYYTFAAALPEGYALSEEAEALEVLVELGGAQMYENSITATKPLVGDGSKNNPYKISTAAELYWFAALVNGDTSVDGVTAADKTACAELTTNITVNSGVLKSDGSLADDASGFTAWTPISTDDANPYTGTFDGKGYTISGLYFNNTNNSYYIGLFGRVGSGSKICNVGIVDSYFNGWSGIGGVCGYCISGEITNCYNTGTVIGTGSDIGGVCGYSSGTITDCYNTGNVSGTSTSDQEGFVGGVCGCNDGYPNMGTITRSYNSGKVSGGYCVGGVCGANGFEYDAQTVNCYNTGEVTGTYDVGGICGFNCRYIEKCYNSAAVSGGSYVGSVCGFNHALITTCYYLTTESELSGVGGSGTKAVNNAYGKTAGQFNSGEVCYLLNASEEVFTWRQNLNSDNLPVLDESHGKVYASAPCPAHFSNSQSDLAATEHSYKDGVCEGCGEVDIRPEMIDGVYQLMTSEQLYWFAEQVNGVKNDLNAVLVNDITVNTGEISESTQDAKVWKPIGNNISPYTGTFDGKGHTISGLYFNDASESSGEYVGLFGYVGSGGSISNVGVVNSYFNAHQWIGGICGYNEGSITNCYSQSTVSISGGIIGGICGGNDGGSITNCYNTGNVIGSGYAGGICGNNRGSITNCFNTGNVSKSSYAGGVCGYNFDGSLLTNCYYLSSTATGGIDGADVEGSEESKTAEQFKSGEVAYLLNEGNSEENVVWRQNLGEIEADATPVLDSTHGIVYRGEPCPDYSNASHKEHTGLISEDGKSHTCSDCNTTEQHADVAKFIADKEANTITATCPAGCELGTVTLTASDTTYDGTQKAAVINGVIKGFDTPSIVYKEKSGDDFTEINSAPTDAGTYRASITYNVNEEAGKVYSVSVTYAISPATPTITWGMSSNGTWVELTEIPVTYTGSEIDPSKLTPPTVTLVNGETYSGEISYSYRVQGSSDAFTSGLPTDIGTYEVKASIAAAGNYTAAESTITLTVVWLDTFNVATLTDQGGNSLSGNDWWAQSVTFAAPTNFTISNNLPGSFGTSFVYDEQTGADGTEVTYYLKNSAGEIAKKTALVRIDKAAPDWSGENDGISIKTNKWKSLLSTISFGLFYKENVDVKVCASDSLSGVAAYYYLIDSTGGTVKTAEQLDKLSFTKYTEGVSGQNPTVTVTSLAPDGNYIVYAYAVDAVGNRSAYVCSEGVVVDSTAPIISDIVAPNEIASTLTDTTAQISFTGSETGTCFYMVKENGETAPTTITDFATEHADDGFSTWTANQGVSYAAMTADESNTVTLTGLEAYTEYTLYLAAVDQAGNSTGTTVYSQSFKTCKTMPTVEEADMPKISGTYGQKVEDMTLTPGTAKAGSTVINGTWTITDSSKTDTPSVGTTATYQVTFTPNASYGDIYDNVIVAVEPTVAPRSLTADGVSITEVAGSFTYGNGAQIEPSVTFGEAPTEGASGVYVMDSGATITIADIKVTYSNNINAGTAKVILTGQGNYTGTVERSFTIDKADAAITVDTGKDSYSKTFGDKAFSLSGISDTNTDIDVQYAVTAGEDVVSVSNGTVTILKAGTATITVSLPASTNYNAADSKTITVNVAKKSGYTVADINKNYLYSRNNAENIDLSGYLPADCGTVSYGTPQTSGIVEYTVSPAVADGKLSYTVKQAETYGATGTIKVAVTTENYADFTITVNVKLIDKLPVSLKNGSSVTLQNSTLTYGQALSTLTFNSAVFVDGDGNEVTGTLAWKTPDATPNAGTTSATWVFTPDDEAYATVENTVAITVNKATPNVTALPTVADRTYNPTVSLTDTDLVGGTVSVGGSWSWQSAGIIPTVNNSGYEAVFTPTDTANYNTVTRTITVAVSKATPNIGDVTVTPNTVDNTTDITKVTLTWSDETVPGELKLDAEALSYASDTYGWTFTPTDTTNYKSVTGNVTIAVNDTIAPTAEYQIGENGWKKFVNTISFGLFCKDYKTVEITYSDDVNESGEQGSGVKTKQYYIANKELTTDEIAALQWNDYTNAISLNAEGVYVIYVKVEDNAGNSVVLNSEGIVIYAESTLSPTSMDYTYKENADREVQIALNGNTFGKLTDAAGTEIAAENYAIDGTTEKLTLKAAYLDTLKVGEYTYKVSMNPQGQTTNAVTLAYSFVVNVKAQELTVTGATATDRVYDTTKAVAITAVELSGIRSGEDVSVDTTNLTGTLTGANAGSYTSVTLPALTLTGADAGNYKLVQPIAAVSTTVTISKADAQITVDTGKDSYSKTFGDADFTLSGISDTNTEVNVQYAVTAGEDVVSVSNGTVTILKAGTATITVSLPASTNYNAAASKTITVTVAKKSGYTVADINKSYLYSRDNEDTIDLSGYLPANCGTVTYDTPLKTGDLYTAGGQPAVSNDGKLSYTVKLADSAGATGTIQVTVTTDNYADFTLTVNVKLIDKFPVSLKEGSSVTLQNSTLTYGQALSKLTFNSAVFVGDDGNEVAGTLAWKTPDEKPNAGTTTATWVFTPNDASYATLEDTVAITVNKATPQVTNLPTVAARTYNPTVSLTNDDLTDGTVNVSGSWSWQTANLIPTVNNSGYVAVFTPADSTNYETVTRAITVTVTKATPYIKTAPTAAAVTYGDTLGASMLSGGTVQYSTSDETTVVGSFTWKDSSVKPSVSDSGTTAYRIVFNPSDAENYSAAETDITLTVNKAENAPDMPSSTMNVANSCTKVSDVTLPTGWVWQDADKDTALTVDTPVTATAVYNGADAGNYVKGTVAVTITRSACDHVAGEIIYTGEGEHAPTCTVDGIGHKACTKCGVVIESGIVVKAAHKFSTEWTIDKAATTTEEGSKSHHCTVCDEKTDITVIPKLNNGGGSSSGGSSGGGNNGGGSSSGGSSSGGNTGGNGSSGGSSSGGTEAGTGDQPENSGNTTTITNGDGSTTTTKTETDTNGNTITTSTTVAADGSSTEKVQATETNTAGKEVAVTTTTKTDADGNVTSVTEKSVIDNITKDTTATITVKTGRDGKVTSAKASVTKISDSTKVSLSGKVLDQITEAAGADVNVRVSMTVKDNDGKTKYTVQADVNEVIPGEKLYIYKLDTKTGKYTMVDNKKYEVTKAGTVTVNMTKKATYELVTAEESKAITKEILATVKPAKKSKSLPVKNTTTFKLSDMLDMDNIKRITYATSKKSVANITKKGTIKAVKAGTATVKATVTLKNGTKKTIKMTIKVK